MRKKLQKQTREPLKLELWRKSFVCVLHQFLQDIGFVFIQTGPGFTLSEYKPKYERFPNTFFFMFIRSLI